MTGNAVEGWCSGKASQRKWRFTEIQGRNDLGMWNRVLGRGSAWANPGEDKARWLEGVRRRAGQMEAGKETRAQ